MFTQSQAVAILEAETVLQGLEGEGPYATEGSAWRNLVSQALEMVDNEYDDLSLVQEIKGL